MIATRPRGTRPRRLGVAWWSTLFMMSASLLPSNGSRPLAIWNSSTPRFQMSSEMVAGWPCQRCGLV